MHCPFCGHEETKVNDSRLAGEGRQIRRRRECLKCGERFTTFETAELVMPVVVKGDRAREAFDEAKLRAGMEKALEKRPVSREAMVSVATQILANRGMRRLHDANSARVPDDSPRCPTRGGAHRGGCSTVSQSREGLLRAGQVR